MTTAPRQVRRPAVAGSFYPASPERLLEALRQSFARARVASDPAPVPKAIIVPHAGYTYSGPIAASAYLRLVPARETVRRVVLIGPSHRVLFRGLAVSGADALATPLGLIPIDIDARRAVMTHPGVRQDDLPHATEHSLEVQLPFLQTVLAEFVVLPLAVGRCDAGAMADVIDARWGGSETVVVLSTDLSHYQRYAEATVRDQRTAAAIVAGASDAIDDADACGAYGLRGLLEVARRRHLVVEQIDLRNSGDTAGDRESVVGYGAFGLG
jgi:AmmeMemoRadiSam system protein B